MDKAERIVRPALAGERDWTASVLCERWGGPTVVGHGHLYEPATLPMLLAEDGGNVVGILTYVVEAGAMEVVTVDSLEPRRGVGTALLRAAVSNATAHGCARIWLITTNDNLDALRLYQKLGFRIVSVSPGAVDRARRRKPAIPLRGAYDIPLHDELELEIRLPCPGAG